jgi:endoglycosylceramidase
MTSLQLMNEPFAGAVLRYPDLLLPGVAGARNLQPLYDAAGAGIRSTNQKHIIFYEPVDWGMVFEGRYVARLQAVCSLILYWRFIQLLSSRYLGTGISAVPGGPQWANVSCLSYHYYCSSFGGSRSVCDDAVGPDMFHSMKDEVRFRK